jgi:hypothetical protein
MTAYNFGWGFSDIQQQTYPLADMSKLYAAVAPLKPQYWRMVADWGGVSKSKDAGTFVNSTPPTTSNRNWTTIDRCINDMLLAVPGMNIILDIGQSRPVWDVAASFFGIPIPFLEVATAVSADDYGHFCGEVASRYRPGGVGIRTDGVYSANAGRGVKHFEIWNEQNSQYWLANVNPSLYTQYLKAAYTAIKSVLPGTLSTVIFGGMQHIPRFGQTYGTAPITMTETAFLAACYAAGAGGYFDAMADHVYTQSDTIVYASGSTLGPSPALTTDNFLQLQGLHDLMVTNGDGAKPIYITECGFATNSLTQELQSTYMQQAFSNFNNLPYVGAVLIDNIRDIGTDTTQIEDTYGVMTYGFVKKQIWTWLQTISTSNVVTPPPTVDDGTLAVTYDGTVNLDAVDNHDGTLTPTF